MSQKKRTAIGVYPGGYPTLGTDVYLGRVGSLIRKRAKRAGLTVVSLAQFRKIIHQSSAIERLFRSGEWHDTVKY